ncbi:hypothetical protein [Acinetobacter gyllenbergii]|uniref:hypothetical protein n=1 Tax=Acinetobacter gyllenbergii TaxID=134534 RepID=UPI003F555D92
MSQNQDLDHDIDDYSYESSTHAPESGKSNKEKFIIIGAVVVGLLLVVFLFMGKKGGNKQVAQDVPVEATSAQEPPPAVPNGTPMADPNMVAAGQNFQNMPVPYQETQMMDVPVTMPKQTQPVSGDVTIKNNGGQDIPAYSYEGQQLISQFNATNNLQPVYVPNTPAPVNPNSPQGQMMQQSALANQELIQAQTENSQLRAQLSSMRDVVQRQHITIGQLQSLVKNTRANQGANIVTLRETKKGVAVGKAIPANQEVIATVGNRVWLTDGRNTSSYAVGDRLPTGYRVLDVNEQSGEVSFTK